MLRSSVFLFCCSRSCLIFVWHIIASITQSSSEFLYSCFGYGIEVFALFNVPLLNVLFKYSLHLARSHQAALAFCDKLYHVIKAKEGLCFIQCK
ncbi:hypothetical protein AO398_11710 [Methylobacterium sp. GXS13]|nr:hypothetical protein AO398_11710 [Methylobacterium sp. GXS13]